MATKTEPVTGYTIELPGGREVWVAKLPYEWQIELKCGNETQRLRINSDTAAALVSLLTNYPGRERVRLVK